jgi:hypothetical protein
VKRRLTYALVGLALLLSVAAGASGAGPVATRPIVCPYPECYDPPALATTYDLENILVSSS